MNKTKRPTSEDIKNTVEKAIEIKPKKLFMKELKWKYLVRSILRGKNILIVGPSGSGKTFAVQSVVDALDRMEAMQDRVERAENSRNKALADQMKAEKEVQKATENLDKAKQKLADVQGTGAKVTAEEELAILRAKQAVDELTEAQDGSRQMELELAIAKQEHALLIQESTALSREEEQALREVEQAEKDLTRAEDLRTEAIAKVTEAQKELNKVSEQSFRNTLEQAIAQEQLTKALASFGEGTKGYEDALKKMASITGIEIDKLMKKYDELFAKSSRIGLSPSPASVSETTSSSAGTGGGTVFPATGGIRPSQREDLLARIGETNVTNVTVNTGSLLGSEADVEEAVSRALVQAQQRGITVI